MPNNLIDLEELKDLSEEERKYALEILKEFSQKGSSEKLNKIMYEDYEEIPVTIEEFLHNPIYLGKALTDEEGRWTLFPYWEECLKKIFPNNVDVAYNTGIFTGAIGLGKSTIAVIVILYQLYKLMCLKNPYTHYKIQEIDTITVAFMNITLDASKGVAWSKCQNMLQRSKWFMNKGTLSKGLNPEWKPPQGIELIYGSLPRHIIGRAVFACLDENTIVNTSDGDIKIKDLVGKNIKIKNIDDNFNLIENVECTVLPTIYTDEEIEVELEDGSIIKCTPNHRFMLKDGTYKEARYLTENDEILDFDYNREQRKS